MKKAEIRQRAILDHLIKYGSYSQEDIMKDYDIKLRSMKSDIAFLNSQGYVIESVNGVYHFLNNAEGFEAGDNTQAESFYDAADRIKIRKLILTLIISESKEGYTADFDGIKAIAGKMRNDDFDETKDISKTIENTLEDMLGDGELLISGGKYVLTSASPVQLPLSENDAMALLELIGDTSKGNPYEDILNDIEDKLEIALLGQDIEQNQYTKRVLQGGKVSMSDNVKIIIDMLEGAQYTQKQIAIKYRNKNGIESDIEFSAGLLLYVPGKKKLYLIGEAKGHRMVLDCAGILAVSATDKANDIFKSAAYKELAETMFEISADDPVHVKVRFDDLGSIRDKLTRLSCNRKYAHVYQQDDKLIYEDEISGLSDFAHFVRRFGYGAEVLEPLELREKMTETSERILLAYGQEL